MTNICQKNSLNVGATQIATMNSSGIYSSSGTKMIGTDGSIGNSSISGATVSGNLNFDATGTTGIRLPAANTLSFHTTGTEDMRIDSSGNVGIGVTPSAWASGDTILQIKAGSGSGAIWGRSNALRLIANAYYDGSAYKYVASDFATQLIVNQSTIGGFTCSAAPTGTAGATATFTQILSLEKDKSLALQGAACVSGTGITFPASQSASSDANTLDDYEEGSWTATVSTGGIASQSCRYTKIGRAVTISGAIAYNGASVDPSIAGLPFTSANTYDVAVAVYSNGMEVSSGGPVIAFVLKNSTQLLFYSWVNNSLGSAYQSSGDVSFTCTYFV
jgi:hypothetical protein